MNAYDIIIRPIITERSMSGVAEKKYVFEVAKNAGKIEIKKAVEEIFGVKVAAVNTVTMRGKAKRLALKSVLSAKAAEGKLVVIDSIKMDAIKTADFRKFLTAVNVDGKAVVVTPAVDNVIVKSARNIPGRELER